MEESSKEKQINSLFLLINICSKIAMSYRYLKIRRKMFFLIWKINTEEQAVFQTMS